MSTRAVIARADGDTWAGRYQHSDGYPTGLGRDLWRVWHEYRNTDRMLHDIIDEHPTGWSHYNGPNDQRCYCHPERAVGPYADGWHSRRAVQEELTIRPEDDTDTEFAYVFGKDTMTVYERGYGEWHWRGTFRYSDPEPNWAALEA